MIQLGYATSIRSSIAQFMPSTAKLAACGADARSWHGSANRSLSAPRYLHETAVAEARQTKNYVISAEGVVVASQIVITLHPWIGCGLLWLLWLLWLVCTSDAVVPVNRIAITTTPA